MVNNEMIKALNTQLNEEMNSFYIYLAMAGYLESTDFVGMAAWMRAQAEEEYTHAMKFYGYINDRGGKVEFDAMAKPSASFAKPIDVFKAALKHEQHITACIGGLVEKATAEKDHATVSFLQWFVSEQVEEESTLEPIIRRFELVGDAGAGLYMLDRELGQRGQGA